MICLQGKTVCGGIALGTAYVFCRNTQYRTNNKSVNVTEELNRIELAVTAVKEELIRCAEQAENDTAKEIFEIHRMMLEDDDVLDFLRNAIQNDNLTAEMAVAETENYFSKMFCDTNDEYIFARIDDIRDICGRLTVYLSGENLFDTPQGSVVLVADELLPGDLMRFKTENLKGIVMSKGSVYSHVAILIKEMGIPALICENIDEIKTGMSVLLNADSSAFYVEPDNKTIEYTKQLVNKKKTFLFDNFPCKFYVNVGNPQEVSRELLQKCDGIGLFRTEYIYFDRTDLPCEEEQFEIYKEILEKADGKNVTIRTFDIGSDKVVKSLPLEREENPALSFRGLRVYLLYPDVFKTQLKALLRAAVYGNLRIMYPMVTSHREIYEIKKIVEQIAQELSEQGIPYKMPLQGAMIETPAAALLSCKIAETVDFLSVGTNDLTQYTLAIDRQNGQLDAFNDEKYEAVLTLIKIVAENAHKNGIEIGICGELASQPELTQKWIDMNMDYLSVSQSVLKR